MATETKYLVVLKINKEHHTQIKNTYYSCIHLTHILYYFNQLKLNFFNVLLLENWYAWLIQVCGVFQKNGMPRNYLQCYSLL